MKTVRLQATEEKVLLRIYEDIFTHRSEDKLDTCSAFTHSSVRIAIEKISRKIRRSAWLAPSALSHEDIPKAGAPRSTRISESFSIKIGENTYIMKGDG